MKLRICQHRIISRRKQNAKLYQFKFVFASLGYFTMLAQSHPAAKTFRTDCIMYSVQSHFGEHYSFTQAQKLLINIAYILHMGLHSRRVCIILFFVCLVVHIKPKMNSWKIMLFQLQTIISIFHKPQYVIRILQMYRILQSIRKFAAPA